MVVRLVHAENAAPPMLVTLKGIVTIVRLVHPMKTARPNLVTL